jgi:tripartite ATP-independent transporter DctM subunit
LGGVFTPTEAAAVAVLYAFFLTIFVTKTLKREHVLDIFYKAGVTASSVLFIVGASVAFGWLATISQVPHRLSEFLVHLSCPNWMTLLLAIAFILFVGMFLDAAPAILILGPILTPAMVNIGFDKLHFSILMCVIITVGLVTPPIGVVLFLASGMTKTKVEIVAREMAPFLLTHLIVILLLAFIPELSLALPRLMGFIR